MYYTLVPCDYCQTTQISKLPLQLPADNHLEQTLKVWSRRSFVFSGLGRVQERLALANVSLKYMCFGLTLANVLAGGGKHT